MAFQCGHPDEAANWIKNGKLRPRCRTCKHTGEARAKANAPERYARGARSRQQRYMVARGRQPGHRNARKTRCPAGHEYTPENTYLYRGVRMCKTCRRGVCRLRAHQRRAAGVLTTEEWEEVLDLYGRACLACGSGLPPTIDHIVPTSRGGSNSKDNVQPLCGPCNSSKGTKTIDYRPVPVALSRS